MVMCKHRFCNVRWCTADQFLCPCVCDMDHESAIKYHYHYHKYNFIGFVCVENIRRRVWSAYVLHVTMPIELCITYPEMLVFARTRLAIVSGPLMPCWETTCTDFLYDAHLHPTFLFDRFKFLMLFANLHFSSIVQRSCMEAKCSSCLWIVSVFAS